MSPRRARSAFDDAAPRRRWHVAARLFIWIVVTAGCNAARAPRHAAIDAGGSEVAAAELACVPRVTPRGITAFDAAGRVLNARGIHVVDWDGFLANPAETVALRPPRDVGFPLTALLTANHSRLYFDRPSSVGATGPSKTVVFDTADSTVTVQIGIFPDRDGADESYLLRLELSGPDPRTELVTLTVHDQDLNRPVLAPIEVTFARDRTEFFRNAEARAVVRQAAADWAYFVDDMQLDRVPVGDELTFIWSVGGFGSGGYARNVTPYAGFLLYAYGIHGAALRSGGEGSLRGRRATSGGLGLPIRRSGGVEIETRGNYDATGYIIDLDPDLWWRSGNLSGEPNDLYSIALHEIGHAHGFNGAYPRFRAARGPGLRSPALLAYQGGPLAIDRSEHFEHSVDPDSGFGDFGNEYYGRMPARRWMITRTDVLALEAIGYRLRPLSFSRWQDIVPDCP